MSIHKLYHACLSLFLLICLGCGEEVAYPTSIAGQGQLADGSPVSNHLIIIEGIRERVCPPVVFCDEHETISTDSAFTNFEGKFMITLDADPEVDFYQIRMDGSLSGANVCYTYSHSVNTGARAQGIILTLYCDN